MKIISLLSLTLLLNISLFANESLSLDQAIDILKKQNLEIQVASLEIKSAVAEADTVSGISLGKLDFTQDMARSNDAGNVFGFKLSSREASFNDFGFNQFLDGFGVVSNDTLLATQPNNLNYPESRNYFQSKLKYEVPLFTGFALTNHENIMQFMTKMKTLNKEQIVNEKVYELRKSFYDMALLNSSSKNLETISNNISLLEEMTENMINVGYAKKVDLLEVQAKKGNVQRLLIQMESNKNLLYHYISFLLNTKVTQITTPTSELLMPQYSEEDILENNLDIQKAQTGLLIRESMVNVSKASYYPTLGAFGEVSTADDAFLNDAADHKAYTVGARLTWNVFNGGIDSSKIEHSRLEQLKTASQVQLARKGIALQIAKIYTQIKSADAEIKSLEAELALADVIYKNYEGRYKEKLSSMVTTK